MKYIIIANFLNKQYSGILSDWDQKDSLNWLDQSFVRQDVSCLRFTGFHDGRWKLCEVAVSLYKFRMQIFAKFIPFIPICKP